MMKYVEIGMNMMREPLFLISETCFLTILFLDKSDVLRTGVYLSPPAAFLTHRLDVPHCYSAPSLTTYK